MSCKTYRRQTESGVLIWQTERLWTLVADLPVTRRPLSDFTALDEVRWFSRKGGPQPTCRAVAIHAKLIEDADLSYPIILSSDGDVMDGMHRMAKAFLLGLSDIDSVQFDIDPCPDEVEYSLPTNFSSVAGNWFRSLPGRFGLRVK